MKKGEKAPAFALQDKEGKTHALKDVKAAYTIIYFYPRDSTPGCTVEAQQFQKELGHFKKLKTAVIGISGGDEKSKEKFCSKNKLTFPLLSDPDFKVCKAYGVYGKKKFMGKEYYGINRVSFVLDKNKKVIKMYKTVKPLVHAREVLDYIKEVK